jgi:2-phosphoglycerate kinase
MNRIPTQNRRYVQRAREDVPERTIHRCTQYIRYARIVKWYEEEAAARGVNVVRDETLPQQYALVEVSDDDPTVEIWT